jgi:hypothetical protein
LGAQNQTWLQGWSPKLECLYWCTGFLAIPRNLIPWELFPYRRTWHPSPTLHSGSTAWLIHWMDVWCDYIHEEQLWSWFNLNGNFSGISVKGTTLSSLPINHRI